MESQYLCRKQKKMEYYISLKKEDRITSYDYIESFISEAVGDWSKWNKDIGTDKVEEKFSNEISKWPNPKFEFLLIHSGYIPDYYGKDSSEETLYSKLIESIVCNWAKRVGITESYLQKKKSNKEDITILKDGKVIVCDAKSFRLGRSQASPNVKDTIKKEAYAKWLSSYEEDKRIGGLTTFPSLHNWKKGGAAYSYYTEGNPPIMILFYEQMAYILHKGITADNIINFLQSYSDIFPKASEEQKVYWEGLRKHLFVDSESYKKYMAEAEFYLKEKATHSLKNIESRISQIEQEVNDAISNMSDDDLRSIARDTLIGSRTKELREQEKHIKEFRPLIKD